MISVKTKIENINKRTINIVKIKFPLFIVTIKYSISPKNSMIMTCEGEKCLIVNKENKLYDTLLRACNKNAKNSLVSNKSV